MTNTAVVGGEKKALMVGIVVSIEAVPAKQEPEPGVGSTVVRLEMIPAVKMGTP